MKRNCSLRHFVLGAGVLSIIIALFTACPNPSSSDPVPEQKLTVTYNGNGADRGDVPVDSNEYSAGASVTVLDNTGTLRKDGFDFAGWKTTSDGTTVNRIPGSSFTIGSTNVVLYAHWVAEGTTMYTVTFDSNGGSTVDSLSMAEGSLIPEPDPDPVKAGNAFDGWYEDDESFINPWNFASDTVSGNTTLYAKWAPAALEVTFNAYGGKGIMEELELFSGDSQNLPKAMYARSGYDFDGWSLTPGGAKAYDDEDSFTMGSSDKTLYARWVAINRSSGLMPPTSTYIEALLGLSIEIFDLIEHVSSPPMGIEFVTDPEEQYLCISFTDYVSDGGEELNGVLVLELIQETEEFTVIMTGSLSVDNGDFEKVSFLDASWTMPDGGGEGPMTAVLDGSMVFDGTEYQMDDILEIVQAAYSLMMLFGEWIIPSAMDFMDAGSGSSGFTKSYEWADASWSNYANQIVGFDVHAYLSEDATASGAISCDIDFTDPPVAMAVNGSLSITDYCISQIVMTGCYLYYADVANMEDGPPETVSGTYRVDGTDYDVEYLVELTEAIESTD